MPTTPEMKQARIQMLLKSAMNTTQEQGIIAGVANITDFLDLGDDRILDGAFNKTLSDHGGKFPLEMDHGWGLAAEVGIGYFSVSGHNFQLDRGVLNLANKRVADEVYPTLLMRAEHGIQAGLSIVYSVVKARMTQEGAKTIREIQEVKLYKVGIVDDPMCQNEDGTIGSFLTSVKSLPQGDTKVADDAAKAAQAARSHKYGIAIREDGHITKPSEYSDVPDEKFADPVNYAYPMETPEHAHAALAYWSKKLDHEKYSAKDRAVIERRMKILAKEQGVGVDDDREKRSMTGTLTKALAQGKGAISNEIARRNLSDSKWDLDSAFRGAHFGIMSDDHKSVDEKLTALTDLLDEYKTLLLEWTQKMLAITDDGEDDEKKAERVTLLKSIVDPPVVETKEGRRLSAATTDALTKCVKSLDDDMTAYDNLNAKHAAERKAHVTAMVENMKGLKGVINDQPDNSTDEDDKASNTPPPEVKSLLELIQAELKG